MKIIALSLGAAVVFSPAAMAESVLSPDGKVQTFIFRKPAKPLDGSKVVPMRLPTNRRPLPSLVDLTIEAAKVRDLGLGTFVPGGKGVDYQTRIEFAVSDPAATAPPVSSGGVGPQDYGTGGQPYTMARIPGPNIVPYREAGLLTFKKPGNSSTFSCSAALVKPGIAVTAAHCIVPYGSTQFNSSHVYLPAGSPYGSWQATSVSVLSTWTAGTSPCTTAGIVCRDDVGIVTLAPKNGANIGTMTGWFGYSTNSYYFANGQAEITQLGYSAGFDGGTTMLRTDSQGSVSPSNAQNTIIGSPLGDGADGGPWVVNLGARPDTNGGYGTAAGHNIIVGVTSWSTGTTSAQKQAGASPFLAHNFGDLLTAACNATPSAC